MLVVLGGDGVGGDCRAAIGEETERNTTHKNKQTEIEENRFQDS